MDWSNLTAFAIEVFNYGAVGTFLPLPMQMPGFPGLYADQIDDEPFVESLPGEHSVVTPAGQTVENYVVATISYKTIEHREVSDFVMSTTFGGEFLLLPNTWADWATPDPITGITDVGQDTNLQFGKLIPTFDHTLKIDRLTSVPWNLLRSLVGHVNDATVLGAPAETILLAGANVESKTNLSGTTYSAEIKISERPTNWNKFYRPDLNIFDYIRWRGYKAYIESDLGALFT